jgi:uncharacterized protein
MFIRIALLTALAAFATASQAVSFDCQKAKTFTEKAVCQDPELSAVDDQLSDLYKTAEASSKNPKALKKEQEKWLKTRDTCQTNACVKKAYQKRIIDLTPE